MAYWWPLLMLIGLFVTLVFIRSMIITLYWWGKYKGKYTHPYKPFLIHLIAIAIVYSLPSHRRSKQYPIRTVALCDNATDCDGNLRIKYYCVGANNYLSTNMNSEYLTDDVNFRLYLGEYDENDLPINVTCKGDSVTIERSSNENIDPYWSKPIVLERKTYSVKDLRKQHHFD